MARARPKHQPDNERRLGGNREIKEVNEKSDLLENTALKCGTADPASFLSGLGHFQGEKKNLLIANVS